MLDEYGCDYDWTPEPRRWVTAILPHPGHGRLVEKAMLMVSYVLCFKEHFYTLSWKEGDVAYYQPAYAEEVPAACGCAH